MFYSHELLSLRRRGKFARCWLAATISEKIFKKTVNQKTLENIKVAYLCEEILSAIEVRGDRIHYRMSLYLVSQLMYGATKILFYQTQLLQDFLFGQASSLSHKKRDNDEFTLEMALNEPNDPPTRQMINDHVSRKLHLITEKPYSFVMNHLIQDETNFGVMTDFDLENFMLPEEEDQFLNEIRKIDQRQSQQINDSIVDIRDIEFIESKKGHGDSFPNQDQREFLVIHDDQFKKPIPGTPKKRASKSLPGTPSKKRKISSKELTPPHTSVEVPVVDVHELQSGEVVPPPHTYQEVPLVDELQPAEVIAQRLEPIQVTDLELQPFIHEHVELTGDTRKRRIRKKLYDKETMLSNNVLRNAIGNVAIHTVEHYSHIPNNALSAKKYLTQPALKFLNRPWAEILIKLFERHLVIPSVTQNEFSNLQIDETELNETLRPDPTSKLDIQEVEISSKLAIIEPNDHSKTINKTQPRASLPHNLPIALTHSAYVPGEQQQEEITGVPPEEVTFPEIPALEEKESETTKELEIQLNGRKPPSSTSGSISSYRVSLTKAEFQALLEVHWHQRIIPKFHDIISPNNYNKLDASRAFLYCLELHAEKVVVLEQTKPYDTISIQRYPCHTSGTSDENCEDLL
ncbi:uncharacterized protein LOC128888844 [Hylaeus anthracinus]|uniref:uncharacterized protein LOC128888844 n=1 Tax=Hylaeus anthracinus TaxID=313031 RepID=UPI0023B93729|nr:uncharacterized protein LOC128888844 [Hylaeus anthracinus]